MDGEQRDFVVVPRHERCDELPAGLIATNDDVIRFVLSHWGVALRGLRLAVAFSARGVWQALSQEHAVRAVFYTHGEIGDAAVLAGARLSRRRWTLVQVPAELREAAQSFQPQVSTAAGEPPLFHPLFNLIDMLFVATRAGAFGCVTSAGPRISSDCDNARIERASAIWQAGAAPPLVKCPAPSQVAPKADQETLSAAESKVTSPEVSEGNAHAASPDQQSSIVVVQRVLTYGKISVDIVSDEVRIGNRIANVPPVPLRLLKEFMLNIGGAHSEAALRQILSACHEPESSSIREHIRKLRLALDHGDGEIIQNVRGVGYGIDIRKERTATR